MRSIRLDKQLSCEYLCGLIQKLVSDHQASTKSLENSTLVIQIKNIIDQDHPPEYYNGLWETDEK